jgi:hypothetical protein
MTWAVNVARMEKGKVHTGFWWRSLREGDQLEDLVVDERIRLMY